MLLKQLSDHFAYSSKKENINLWFQSPSCYIPTAVRFLIQLDRQGKYLGLVSTTGSGKRDKGKEYLTPHMLVTSGIEAKLLVGNVEYALGRPRDHKKKDPKVIDRHRAFVDKIKACALTTGNPLVKAILAFFESDEPERVALPDDFNPADLFTFQVEGLLPVDSEEIRDHWAEVQRDELELRSESHTCIVCGAECFPIKLHPVQLKGIPGGQTSGMALVSANADAFESYGLKRNLIAPICLNCAQTYAKAASSLLTSEDSSLRIGPLAYVFWTREESGFNVARLFSKPEPQDVRSLLASAWKGRHYTALDTEAFYAAALSASGGRVVVRDWLETTVGEAKEHLARWFVLQDLVDWDGSQGSPYGLYPLTASLVHDPRRDLPPNVPRIMLKVALQGGPLPSWLLFQAIKRNRAEQAITRPRAALIKMVLLSQDKNIQEDAMVQMDEGNRHPAYLCGRLLAVLEQVQFLAVSPKATLIDRFYGTASTAPASVFPRLVRGAQPHLGKLRKERFGAYVSLQNRLEGVMQNLASFPKVLTLEEQGWFSLGYYHQRAWDRAQAKARKEEQVPGEDAVVEETPIDENE